MRSRGELRSAGEWALRIALVASLAFALWRSVRGSRAGGAGLAATAATLAPALRDATGTAAIGAIDVAVDGAIPPRRRAWLVALRHAGVDVRWHGSPAALALAADRAREPVSAVRLGLVADAGRAVVLADSVGTIDSLRANDGAAGFEVFDAVGVVRARRDGFAATVAVPLPASRRDVLVLGRAGWESRFVAAALGEAGWVVRTRLPVAPGATVADAGLLPIDTSRYDAVVALDSTAVDLAPAVARFVVEGGGLLAAGSALSLVAFRRLAPARASARRPARILLEGDTLTRADLPLRPLVGVRADAVPLERQSGGLASAIRREGRGRVAALGYDESWRWRMEGGEAGIAAHRAWWSRMVGLVAPERLPARGDARPAEDAAPRASLEASLGPPHDTPLAPPAPASGRLPLALLVLVAVALLAETASRRFRGAS